MNEHSAGRLCEIVKLFLHEAKDEEDDEESAVREKEQDDIDRRIVSAIADALKMGPNAVSGIVNKALNKLELLLTHASEIDLRDMVSQTMKKYAKNHSLTKQDKSEFMLGMMIPERVNELKKLVLKYADAVADTNDAVATALEQERDIKRREKANEFGVPVSHVTLSDDDEMSVIAFVADEWNVPPDELRAIVTPDEIAFMKKNWRTVLANDSFWEWAKETTGDRLQRPEITMDDLSAHMNVTADLSSFRDALHSTIKKFGEKHGVYDFYKPTYHKAT